MLETFATALVAMMLFAGTTHRFRVDSAIDADRVAAVRTAAAILIALALFRCGTALSGERIVRCTLAVSLAAAVVALTLSVAPHRAMRPLRWIFARSRTA